MSHKYDGREAFPYQHVQSPGSEVGYGMTYRQWIAGQALAGLLASDVNGGWETSQLVASVAVDLADALIAELDKEVE